MLDNFVKALDLREDRLVFTGNLSRFISHFEDKRAALAGLLDALLDGGGAKPPIKTGRSLAIHSFNWDFCRGRAYDIRRSRSQTGALSRLALKRPEFSRTTHPIYSFAVAGPWREQLAALRNFSAFGPDSPFAAFHATGASMLIIDLPLQHSFTFVHFVEQELRAPWRVPKTFAAPYTDGAGRTWQGEFEMWVRAEGVETDVWALEGILREGGAMRVSECAGIEIKKIDLAKAYELIKAQIIRGGEALHRRG